MFLERLYIQLGEPEWFYPAVLTIIFVVLPCLASLFEY